MIRSTASATLERLVGAADVYKRQEVMEEREDGEEREEREERGEREERE